MNIFNEEGYIDSEVKEVLYELGNVGLGMASITVGKIMGIRLHIGVPQVLAVDEELEQKLANMKDGISVIMNFQKTLQGSMLFVLKEKFIGSVIEKMQPANSANEDEEDRESALQEFANMICAAYLKAIGQYTGIRLYVKPARMNIHRDLKLLESACEELFKRCDKAICVDTSFSIVAGDGTKIDDVGHVIMLPDEESVKLLVEPLCD